jgi:hypothetical protein
MSIQPALFPVPGSAPVAPVGVKARGAVFTRLAVVEFMLDLVGYTPDRPLHRSRLLEPSFGSNSTKKRYSVGKFTHPMDVNTRMM